MLVATRCNLGDWWCLKVRIDRWLDGSGLADRAPNLVQFVKPRARTRSVASALLDGSWARDFRGPLSVSAIAEFLDLWDQFTGLALLEAPEEISWRLESRAIFQLVPPTLRSSWEGS